MASGFNRRYVEQGKWDSSSDEDVIFEAAKDGTGPGEVIYEAAQGRVPRGQKSKAAASFPTCRIPSDA